MARKKKNSMARCIFSLIVLAFVLCCIFYFKSNTGSLLGHLKSISKEAAYDQNNNVITETDEDLHRGNLILVNGNYPFEFSSQNTRVNISENKNESYRLRSNDMMLNKITITHFNEMMSDFENAEDIHNVGIVSAFRTEADQRRILDDRIHAIGSAAAAKWAAKPGYSEHHTGYAMDIGIITSKGQCKSYTGTGPYSWINKNCGNYGFIHRYDGDKESITGVMNETWHYRYVGMPHANIIKSKGFCLEEYIDFIRAYSQSNPYTYTDFDGASYKIFYVKNTGSQTRIELPKKSDYTISGNNVDGFIVTIKI